MRAFLSAITIGFIGLAYCFEASALPSRPLTQNASGLTQNNTSGLSQNLNGRTATATETGTPSTPYPGVNVPSLPQPFVIGSNPLPTAPAPVQATPVQPATPPAQGSPSVPAQAPPTASSNGAVPEASNNE